MKFILTLLFTLLATTLFAQEHMLKETPYKYVEETIGKGKAHFVEFGSDKCYSCQEMGKKLYQLKKNNPQLNIEFVNVRNEREAVHKFKIRMIPTQLIFNEHGQEVYRHIGVLTVEELTELIKKHKI